MKNGKSIFLAVILSILITFLTILSGWFNWIWQFIICGILFFIGGFILENKKTKTWITIIILLTPFLSIYGFLAIKDWLVHIFPIVFIVIANSFLGVFAKRRYLNSGRKKSILIISGTYLIILSIFGYIFMLNWITYALTRETKIIQSPDFSVQNLITSNKIYLKDINEDIIVLDFWTTTCAICIEKFPEFQELKDHYKNENIAFMAVNIPQKRDNDTNESIEYFHKNNYDFQIVRMDTIYSNNFEIYGVPQLVIIDRNRNIVYKGNFETDKKIIVNNAYRIIDDLLGKK